MKSNDSFEAVPAAWSTLLQKTLLSAFVLTSVFILPFYIHNQIVTGSLVNAGLLVSISLFGLPTALVLCIVPSIIALTRGLLPMAFAPVLPFIMVGNVLYVSIFNALSKKKIFGAVAASVIKFAFLFSVGQLVLSHVIVSNLFQKASLMLGWFQLVTALLGAGIALVINKMYQVNK